MFIQISKGEKRIKTMFVNYKLDLWKQIKKVHIKEKKNEWRKGQGNREKERREIFNQRQINMLLIL